MKTQFAYIIRDSIADQTEFTFDRQRVVEIVASWLDSEMEPKVRAVDKSSPYFGPVSREARASDKAYKAAARAALRTGFGGWAYVQTACEARHA